MRRAVYVEKGKGPIPQLSDLEPPAL